jgi:hypothetical protein
LTPAALPPEKPPPPVPKNLPFQLVVGIAIQIRTLSPVGGCVVTAVTRQISGLLGSGAADSIVVFGSATVARLSHERTGLTVGINAFGAGCAGPAPRPGPGCPCPRATGTASDTTDIATSHMRFARVMVVLSGSARAAR